MGKGKCMECKKWINCEKIAKSGLSEITEDSGCDDEFVSRFIQYPIEVSKINDKFQEDISFTLHPVGQLVAVRPAKDKKTYLGILLGDLPHGAPVQYNSESKELTVRAITNPGIYVFELKKIVFGYESWWKRIEKIEDFSEISNETIDGQWYVQLLKDLSKNKE